LDISPFCLLSSQGSIFIDPVDLKLVWHVRKKQADVFSSRMDSAMGIASD
jgi:hypothetical protein